MEHAKKLLRKQIKDCLIRLSEESKSKQSTNVQQKLFCTKDWQQSRRVAIYLSMKNEISTTEILRRGFEEDKKIFIPRYYGDTMEMLRVRSMEDYESLPETSWKIKQPSVDDHSREVPSPENGGLDLIIVPGLAFTLKGHRLGHGKGYYDRYLLGFKSIFGHLPSTIGLSFREQIVEELPCSGTDVIIDAVLCADDDYDCDNKRL